MRQRAATIPFHQAHLDRGAADFDSDVIVALLIPAYIHEF
jgi:hypothetical protein